MPKSIWASSLVTALFRLDDFDHIVVTIALDHILENDIAVYVLQVDPPAGDLGDVGAIDGLFHAAHAVESRLGKTPMSVAVVNRSWWCPSEKLYHKSYSR